MIAHIGSTEKLNTPEALLLYATFSRCKIIGGDMKKNEKTICNSNDRSNLVVRSDGDTGYVAARI